MALLEGKILSQHFDQQEHCFFVAHQEGNCEYMYFLHFFFGMTPINTNYLVKQSHDATETLQVGTNCSRAHVHPTHGQICSQQLIRPQEHYSRQT